ncbi:glucose 1-dehydrogenase [candidate division KSB1 bacterium]|nr:glucose 1-dehydrogenase [candidate division KSB1 bacterium]
MSRVKNKVAMVTGGSLGIGKASAQMLAKEGAKVAITDIKDDEGKQAVKNIKNDGGEAIFIHHDVSKEEEWKNAISETVKAFGGLDILVNNAGVALDGSAEETTLEDWRWLMQVNLDGVFLGTKYAIEEMKESGGSIINLSSIEGIIGDPNLAAYNASKGGVRLFTKSTALQCAHDGYKIRVNSIHPGYIWTPMVKNYLESKGDLLEGKRQLESLHPIGHLGDPDDIAYGVVYLASDEAKFITGTELIIDGGYTAR